ncbi:cupin domain-containing protein [Nonomuraea typhae]|uniref:cupin domain-containing protein n=1 Tax=Nonomuraea typhae TaxID=2603600 RepID=UPI0012F9671F|nr:cupin domain-containing protein [Nonomuraea typhae]
MAVVVLAGSAERAGGFELLLEGAAFGVNRLSLGVGAEGAAPHLHRVSAEAFYVLEGVVEFWVDGAGSRVPAGGLVVVEPGVAHAFGAWPGHAAQVLVVIAPGVRRFAYLRELGRRMEGAAPDPGVVGADFDVFGVAVESWRGGVA